MRDVQKNSPLYFTTLSYLTPLAGLPAKREARMFELGDAVEVATAYTADWEFIPKGTQGEAIESQDDEVLVKLDLFDHPIWIPEKNLIAIPKRR